MPQSPTETDPPQYPGAVDQGATDRSADDGAGALLDAVLLISSGLDLRGSLERLVEASCALTGARYGVLGLIDEDGVIADYVIHGLDQETMDKIASLPTCEGVLGVLIEDPRPLRLTNVADHARSIGFPPNHPPMASFLGVPLYVDGQVYGNLYLTEKTGGVQFTARDEVRLQTLAEVAGHVIANARTHAISERRHRWREAGIAMSDMLQDSVHVDDALHEVATRLREVADATLVAVIEDQGEGPVPVAVDRSENFENSNLDKVLELSEAVIAESIDSGEVLALPRVGQTVAYVVPMQSKLAPGHCLLVVVDDPGVDVVGPDPELLAAFADQASLSLDRTQALAERQEHLLVADRDRIARDLHDTVIQRLFATALQLQGMRRAAVVEEVKQRLDEAVADLNTTIRDIRSTIFELRHHDGGSLKAEIRGLAKEYVPTLGFTPFVRIRGPVDVVLPPETAEHLLATLREALSNVARHAEADACIVEVEATGDRVVLRVSDNGRGLAENINESGLRNVRRRALDLGGTFLIAAEEPHGTLLEWHVPLTS